MELLPVSMSGACPIHPLLHFPVAPKPITMEQNERTAFTRERGGRREVGVELKN